MIWATGVSKQMDMRGVQAVGFMVAACLAEPNIPLVSGRIPSADSQHNKQPFSLANDGQRQLCSSANVARTSYTSPSVAATINIFVDSLPIFHTRWHRQLAVCNHNQLSDSI